MELQEALVKDVKGLISYMKRDSLYILEKLSRCVTPVTPECSNATLLIVDGLEQKWGVRLPNCYREFLKQLGMNSKELFIADVVQADALDDLQSVARRWLKESHIDLQVRPVFFFYGHHQYEFAFFWDNGSDDPPAYVISETHRTPQLIDDNLSDALCQMIDRAISETAFIAERRRRRGVK
jgi:hypothetical protein